MLSTGFKSCYSKQPASLASFSLRDILGWKTKEAANLGSTPERQHFFRGNDLSFLSRVLCLPHWSAKKHKEFAAIYNRQLQRSKMAASPVGIAAILP